MNKEAADELLLNDRTTGTVPADTADTPRAPDTSAPAAPVAPDDRFGDAPVLQKLGRAEHVGPFFWEGCLCRKKIFRLEKMVDYFTCSKIKAILLPIINKEGSLSLRALDWLVTNYSKKKPIIYNVTPPDCPEVVVNMYRSYKSWLWNHKRKNFDPFRRGQRIFFSLEGHVYESTVGQLNFFFWASRYGVLDYADKHIKEIEKDQAVTTKKHPRDVVAGSTGGEKSCGEKSGGEKTFKKRKRRQLSQPPRDSVFVYPTTIRVVFNPELK